MWHSLSTLHIQFYLILIMTAWSTCAVNLSVTPNHMNNWSQVRLHRSLVTTVMYTHTFYLWMTYSFGNFSSSFLTGWRRTSLSQYTGYNIISNLNITSFLRSAYIHFVFEKPRTFQHSTQSFTATPIVGPELQALAPDPFSGLTVNFVGLTKIT